MIDDADLLRQYVEARSEAAFAEFVKRHLNLVYFAALRRTGGNAALAEEVVQYVFATAARDASSLMRHATVTGWLYTTTRRTAANAARAELTRQRYEQELHLMSEHAAEPAIEWERLRPVIDESLESLSTRDREAVLLRFFEGRAFAEIGAALKISEDAARMRVDRALEKLHALLGRRGVTSTAGALAAAFAHQAALAAPAGLAASVTGSAVAAAVTGSGLGTVVAGIFMNTKSSLMGAGLIGLLGVGFFFGGNARLGARIATESAEQNQTLARLRTENRLLQARNQKMVAELTPAVGAAFETPVDPIARLRVLTDLVVEGSIGIDAIKWWQFPPAADIFGQMPGEYQNVPAERARLLIEMFALTPAEVAKLRELGDRAKAEIARSAIANSVVRRNGNQLTIEVRPGPMAQAAYDRLHAEFRETLGEDRFGLARMIGWEASLEKQMHSVGLSAFTFTSVREAAADRAIYRDGVIYRGGWSGGTKDGSSYQSGTTDLRTTALGPLGVLIPADF